MAELVNDSGNVLFYSTFEGFFVREVSQPTENTVTRRNKMGRTVHELRYNSITGDMKLRTRTGKFGPELELGFYDVDSKEVVSFPLYGSLSRSLLKRMKNIDPDKQVRLRSSTMPGRDGKERTVVWFEQRADDGRYKPVENPFPYQSESEKQIPPPEKAFVNGQEVNDWRKAVRFLYNYAKENIEKMRMPDPEEERNVRETPPDDGSLPPLDDSDIPGTESEEELPPVQEAATTGQDGLPF